MNFEKYILQAPINLDRGLKGQPIYLLKLTQMSFGSDIFALQCRSDSKLLIAGYIKDFQNSHTPEYTQRISTAKATKNPHKVCHLILDFTDSLSCRIKVNFDPTNNSVGVNSEQELEKIAAISDYIGFSDRLKGDKNNSIVTNQNYRGSIAYYFKILEGYFSDDYVNSKKGCNDSMEALKSELNMLKKLNQKLRDENDRINEEFSTFRQKTQTNFHSGLPSGGNSKHGQNLEESRSYEFLMEMLEKEKAKSREILRQNEDLEQKCKEINQKAIEVVNSTYQDVENKLIPLEKKLRKYKLENSELVDKDKKLTESQDYLMVKYNSAKSKVQKNKSEVMDL